LQTYFKRSVQYHACTFKIFTLSCGVINFQTISKLKNSTSTCEYTGKARTCKYSGHKFRQTKTFGAKNARNSPNRQTKIFAAKRFQHLPDFQKSGDKFAKMATLVRPSGLTIGLLATGGEMRHIRRYLK